MRISHDDAILLESVVRQVFGCSRGGMGGYIDADHFELQPFDAALIALAPLWERSDPHELDDFLFNWECAFRRDEGEPADVRAFIGELDELIESLSKR